MWWIRQTILRAIGESSHLIRLPMHKADELLQIAKVREDLQGELCPESRVDGIAMRLHCDRNRVTELLNISRDLLSLEAAVRSGDAFPPLEDLIEDKNNRSPKEILIENSVRDDINAALSSLSQRESEILQCRYGLNGKRPMTLKEIGSKYKLTRERIRQIQQMAIKRLRHPSRSNLLRACLRGLPRGGSRRWSRVEKEKLRFPFFSSFCPLVFSQEMLSAEMFFAVLSKSFEKVKDYEAVLLAGSFAISSLTISALTLMTPKGGSSFSTTRD